MGRIIYLVWPLISLYFYHSLCIIHRPDLQRGCRMTLCSPAVCPPITHCVYISKLRSRGGSDSLRPYTHILLIIIVFIGLLNWCGILPFIIATVVVQHQDVIQRWWAVIGEWCTVSNNNNNKNNIVFLHICY